MTPQTDREILIDIHGRVKAIESRLVEIDELERRLRAIETLAECRRDIDDHETRLRGLEKTTNYAMGLAAAIGAAASFVMSAIKDKVLS